MGFMIGREPVRRTLQYLQAGRLYIKTNIQIMLFNYNVHGDHHKGVREFLFWHLDQIQYKNKDVQIVTIRNRTPTPFIWCFYENGKRMLIDVEDKSKDQILDHLISVIGRSEEQLRLEALAKETKANPANFGYGCEKNCMCIIPGQLPCPQVCPLPYTMRGKYIRGMEDIPES